MNVEKIERLAFEWARAAANVMAGTWPQSDVEEAKAAFRAELAAQARPVDAPTDVERLRAAKDALEEIALAGMSGTGQESEEGMRDWHARRAWEFIGIAARALGDLRATPAGGGER